MSRFKEGFSFIELLVIITILGILISVGSYAYNNLTEKGRDAKRKEDLASIRAALVLYYQDNDRFPGTIVPPATFALYASDTDGSWLPDISTTYMENHPQDPRQAATSTDCNANFIYCYRINAGDSFELFAQLENANDTQIIDQPQAICNKTPPFPQFNYCHTSEGL